MSKLVILGLTNPTGETQENRNLSTILKTLDEKCRNCEPASPLQCINHCKAYKLKNELRTLRKAISNPEYLKELFNVLKNKTRIHIMQTLEDRRLSVIQLQQELKNIGQNQSQGTISEEYLHPLVAVGLIAQSGDEYYATTFGLRLTPLLEPFQELTHQLPAHSECYEEILLQSLLSGPKTFEEIDAVIMQKNVARILKRLSEAKLIDSPRERDYIFFFRSKRDSTLDTFTETERKVYDALSETGISMGNLARATGLSARILYRYTRTLKGKKLAFCRRTPKTYSLTSTGEKIARSMQAIQQIVEDTWNSSEIVEQDARVAAMA